MAFTSCLIILILIVGLYTLRTTGTVNVLLFDKHAPFISKTNDKFLSIGLDSSVIARGFKKFNMSDPKLVKIIGHLSPAYLRVGGNMADCLIFEPNNNTWLKTNIGDLNERNCSYINGFCEYQVWPNFTLNGVEWLNLNDLTRKAKLDMIFDLNVLRRLANDSWDPKNAEELISFSNQHNLDINWQLGNEPNAFRHQFNHEVNATQLARDFGKLKKVLSKYEKYRRSLLIGPDTTRPDPQHQESITYMIEFLRNAGNLVDIISWHQYYFNGRTVVANDFLDPKIFDVLTWQIDIIHKIQKYLNLTSKNIWLTETSSAWGGGSPLYSDKFIASFIWLDKLGLSAKMGIDVVVRQSIFNGYYALITNNYMPNPDYWVSILFKQLVGKEVISCYNVASQKVRLYCHCTNTGSDRRIFSSVTVFGMNMQDVPAKVRIEGLVTSSEESTTQFKILSYTLTSRGSLLTKSVYLNDHLIKLTSENELPSFKPKEVDARPYVVMPPFSIVFWVIPTKTKICDSNS